LTSLNPAKPWPRRPWQPLMRLTDVVNLDVEAMVSDAAAHGVDCLIVSAGGFTAWYPTQLSCQRRNPYMTGDFLGEVVAAAKRHGLQVYGRMDISKGYVEWYQQHPDWYAVDADGTPIRYWELHETCFTGPYFQEYNLQIIDELLTNYPLDGLFYNFYLLQSCHCERCQEVVQTAIGQRVPTGSRLDPTYERWRHQALADYTARIRNRIHHHRPEARLMVYHHLQKGWDPRLMADAVDIWTAQASSPLLRNPLDPQPAWLYWIGEEVQKGQVLKPGVPPMLWLSYSEMFASRRVLQPADRLVTHIAQGAAYGASVCPSLNGVPGRQEDPRPLQAVAAKQHELERLAPFLEKTTVPTRVALVYSPDSFWFGPDQGEPGGRKHGHLPEFRGLYAALIDSRYPFDVLIGGTLNAPTLQRYAVVILPALHCLTDADALALDRWVRDGGCLMATADTGVANADGHPRTRPAAPVFAPLPGEAQSATGGYLRIADPALRAALGGSSLIALESAFLPLSIQGAHTDLCLLGPFRNNAPEFTFWEGGTVGPPGLVHQHFGQGHSIRLPWYIGGLYNTAAIPEYPVLLGWLLEQVTGPSPIMTNAPPSVQVVLREQHRPSGTRWLVHLINNTAAAERPLLSTVVLPPVTVRVRCPARRVYLAVADHEARATRDGEWISVRTGSLFQHELLVLE